MNSGCLWEPTCSLPSRTGTSRSGSSSTPGWRPSPATRRIPKRSSPKAEPVLGGDLPRPHHGGPPARGAGDRLPGPAANAGLGVDGGQRGPGRISVGAGVRIHPERGPFRHPGRPKALERQAPPSHLLLHGAGQALAPISKGRRRRPPPWPLSGACPRRKPCRAAILHDCTKYWTLEQHLETCTKYGVALDELECVSVKLLHAKSAAALARHVFGEPEEECLRPSSPTPPAAQG